MYDILLKNFNRYVELTDEEFEICKSLYRYKKYRKHQYILQYGDVSRCESFVLKGCTRTYEVDDKGQEHIMQFGLESWWVGNMYSFLSGQPSKLNIDCIEDTEVLQIDKAGYDALFIKVPKMERFYRLLIQKAYVASLDRITSNLSKPAAERYLEFIQKYPHIEQRVPNHMIASYLGITPQSLSRIRSQGLQRKL